MILQTTTHKNNNSDLLRPISYELFFPEFIFAEYNTWILHEKIQIQAFRISYCSSIPTIPRHFLISFPDISALVFLHGQNYVDFIFTVPCIVTPY